MGWIVKCYLVGAEATAGLQPVLELAENGGTFSLPAGPLPAFNTVDLWYADACQLRLRFASGSTLSLKGDGQSLVLVGKWANLLISKTSEFTNKNEWLTASLAAGRPDLALSVSDRAIPDVTLPLSVKQQASTGMKKWTLKIDMTRRPNPDGVGARNWPCQPSGLFAAEPSGSERLALSYPKGNFPDRIIKLDITMYVQRRSESGSNNEPRHAPRWRLVFLRQAVFDSADSKSELANATYVIDGAICRAVEGFADAQASYHLGFGRGDIQLTQTTPWCPIEADAHDVWTFGLRGATLRGKPGTVPVGISTAAVLHSWNAMVAESVLASLAGVRGAESVSFVPKLGLSAAEPTDVIWSVLCEARLEGAASTPTLRPCTGLRLRAEAIGSAPISTPVRMELAGFRDHRGRAISYAASLRPSGDEAVARLGQARSFEWSIVDSTVAANPIEASRLPVALGALDLWPGNIPAPSMHLEFYIYAVGIDRSNDPATPPRAIRTVALGRLYGRNGEAAAVIPIARVRPAALDITPEQAQAGNLAQAASEALVLAKAVDGPFRLLVDEAYDARLNRDMTIRLQRALSSQPPEGSTIPSDAPPEPADAAKVEAQPSQVMVFDPAPLFLGQFAITRLFASADASSADIAVYATGPSGLAQWEYRHTEAQSLLRLPPQAIGEAYEFRGDVPDNQAPIDYRLGLHAELSLDNNAGRRAFAPLPFNWRQVFGYPGQPGAGAGLLGAQFELLYGLEFASRSTALRAIEHGAERGRPAPAWGDTDSAHPYVQTRKHWNTLRKLANHRLAALELRDGGASSIAVGGDSPHGVRVRHESGPRPADLAIPDDPNTRHRLKGALYWPIRSANVRGLLLEQDGRASSGRLDQVALTALGAYGAQRVRFAGDRLGIESHSAQGRVSYHSVEVIGRIGCFWNRAKHVVIYERTVARRSRYAAGSPEEQSALRGRAVIRKVAEYVEILEQERRYPDCPDGTPAHTGPTRAVRFRSRQIPVSEAWGRDIGNLGWVLPLWRRPADPSNPSAYELEFPKPQVSVELAGSSEDTLWCDIDNPEDLLFFAYTAPSANDQTDHWPVISGVDRVEGTLPPLRMAKTASADELDRPGTAPPDVLPMLAPCTWRLAAGGAQSDVLAARANEALGAVIDVISMMRGGTRDISAHTEVRDLSALQVLPDGLRQAADAAHAYASTLAGRVDNASLETLIQKRLTGELTARTGQNPAQLLKDWKHIAVKVATFNPCQMLKDAVNTAITAHAQRWEQQAGRWKAQLLDAASERGDAVQARIGVRIDGLIDDIRDGALLLDGGAAGFASQARGQLLDPLRTRLRELQDALRTVDARVSQLSEDLPTRLQSDRQAVHRTLRAAFQEIDDYASSAIERGRWVRGKLATSKVPEIQAFADELDSTLYSIHTQRQLYASSVDAELTAAESATDQVLVRVRAAVASCAVEATKLRAEVDQRMARLLDEIDVQLASAEAAVAGLRDRVQRFRADAVGQLTRLKTNLQQAADPSTRRALIDEAWDRRTDPPPPPPPPSLLELWSKLVKDARPLTEEFLDEQICPLLPKAGELQKLMKSVEEALQAIVNGSANVLRSIDTLRQQLAEGFDSVRQYGERQLQLALAQLPAIRDRALALLRAVGKPPELPGISFNLPRIEFRFDPRQLSVDITPLTSYFAQAGDYLKSLGLRIPTVKLSGRGFEMPDLDFDLSTLLPDFSGIKLKGLFERLKLPKAARDQIKLTHGIDRKRKLAWAQADVDMPLGGARTLFNAATVEVRLLSPVFVARSRLEIDSGGRTRTRSDARLQGDIQLLVAGTSLVRMRNCRILFDEGGDFEFKFDPRDLEFDGAMLFLTKLMAAIPGSDSAFFPELLERDGRPYGIETKFDLVPPALQFGTFGISGLRIGMRLRLAMQDGEFRIGTRLSLGAPQDPFTITVFILGGSGWLRLDTEYRPATRAINSEVVVALGASATLAIRFGPIAGSVQVFFGIRATFRSGAGAGFAIAVVLMLNGGVVIFGFVRVGLHVLLEIEYSSDGSLVGRGVVELEVRISRFFKRSVRQRIRHVFKRGGGAKAAAQAPALVASNSPATDAYAQRIATYRQNRV